MARFQKMAYLISFVSLLLAGQVGLAVQFYDDFSARHNYLTEGVVGTVWDGFAGLSAGDTVDSLNANTAWSGKLHIESHGAYRDSPFHPLGSFVDRSIDGDFAWR